MAGPRGRRVLVAVEPIVLEGAFAAILELLELDEVVQFHVAPVGERARWHDAAIVSAELSGDVHAGVVITLPDTQAKGDRAASRARGHVRTHAVSDDVDIRDQHEVVELLDEYLPIEVSRADRLKAKRRRVS